MVGGKLIFIAAVVGAMGIVSQSQQKTVQSPRQAILEMLSGREEDFKKHLTLEVQEKLGDLLKSAAPGSASPIQAMSQAKAAGGDNLQTFDDGPILFSFNNPQRNERLEVRVDGDDLDGDEDDMRLSLHALRNGREQDVPVGIRLALAWKQQAGIWRLNAFTISATLPVGDPRILDKSWWVPPAIGPIGGSGTAVSAASPTSAVPKITPARSVRLIAVAEGVYSKKHPDIGYTCLLSDLVNIGKGLNNGETYTFIDPEFADGVYNGYKFVLRRCIGKPARSFQVTAEPLSGVGKAYCEDTSLELRAADDGKGASCVASGRPVGQ